MLIYTVPNFQRNTKLPYIFKEQKLYVRLNQCIVLFLFSTFDSSPKQLRFFMPPRKKLFKEKQRKRSKCWLLAFSPSPTLLISDEKCALFCTCLETKGL